MELLIRSRKAFPDSDRRIVAHIDTLVAVTEQCCLVHLLAACAGKRSGTRLRSPSQILPLQ